VRWIARFLLISVVLTIAAMRWGDALARALIPVFRTEIEILDDTFQVTRLVLDRSKAEAALRMEVVPVHPVVLGGGVYPPDPRGRAWASAPAAHLTVVAIVLCATAFSARVAGGRALATRMAASLSAVILLWLLDVPACLLGSVWDLVIAATATGEFSAWVAWLRFLENGGRFALALAFGAVCALVGQPAARPLDGGSGTSGGDERGTGGRLTSSAP
jgi:hypothetical protein